MTKFQYIAKDAKGRKVKGVHEATDERSLINLLREKALTIISISEAKGGMQGNWFTSRSVPLAELVIFTRQMATLIDAGIPLIQAIEIQIEQTNQKKEQ